MQISIKNYDVTFNDFLEIYHKKDEKEHIGSGWFGKVYKVTPQSNEFFKYSSIDHINGPIVMKTLFFSDDASYSEEQMSKFLKREYYIHKLLGIYENKYIEKHGKLINATSYFIKMYDIIRVKDAFIVYMDYIEGYNLEEFQYKILDFQNLYMSANEKCKEIYLKMNEKFYILLLLRLVEGLSIIHYAGIVHLDAFPRNIMFNKGDIKYIDFGESCFFEDNDYLNQDKVSTLFKCQFKKGLGIKVNNIKTPEKLIYNDDNDKKLKSLQIAEMWYFGRVMYDLVTKTMDNSNLVIKNIDILYNELLYQKLLYEKLSPISKKIIDRSKDKDYKGLDDKDKIDVLYEEYYYQNRNAFDEVKNEKLREIIREVTTGRDVKLFNVIQRLKTIYKEM
jgi:serine/threonine protein kinase